MKINIRKAKISEAEILTELAMQSKAHWGYSDEFISSCREELTITGNKLTKPLFHYSVAEYSNEILGFYALEILDKSKIELDALFVHPKNMGKGIGKALMNHAKNLALRLGSKTIIIQGDPNAEGFYITAGAKKIGEKESGSIPGRFLPIFEIAL